ncbi:MAG: ThiF family adenylyltransferase [Candidatus Levyibacteriota bacterium]
MQKNEIPKVLIYDLSQTSGWEEFKDSLQQLPKKIQSEQWHSLDFEEVVQEAQQRGFLLDTLAEYVKDMEKLMLAKTYFAQAERPYRFPEAFSTDWHTACIVEFPWKTGNGRYVVLPPKDAFLFLTSTRNEIIIPEVAQQAFQKIKIGFAGAGVGSSLVEGVVRAGVQNIIVADGGNISFHDLNRLQSPDVASIGENHAINCVRKALQTNPFLNATCIPQNLGEDDQKERFSIRKFLNGVDIIFEEVDNLAIKIAIRKEARAQHIPVIMATDVGFGTVIEFQKGESDAPIFPLITEEEQQKLLTNTSMSLSEKTALAIKMVGPEAHYWQQGVEAGLTFWSQTGAAADVSKAKGVETLVKWVMNEEIPTKQSYFS